MDRNSRLRTPVIGSSPALLAGSRGHR